eukprot:scaffold100632_cov24-Cyclotella_meneghiniana.AAC.2
MAIGMKPWLLSSIWPIAVSLSVVMDLPVRWLVLVPPTGCSNFFLSHRRALGSSLFLQSGVIVEEEVSECISVTSKPIGLRGHLH